MFSLNFPKPILNDPTRPTMTLERHSVYDTASNNMIVSSLTATRETRDAGSMC
jgi:hypothetical protein